MGVKNIKNIKTNKDLRSFNNLNKSNGSNITNFIKNNNIFILFIIDFLVLFIYFILGKDLLFILVYLIIINLVYFLLIKLFKIYTRTVFIKKLEDSLILEILKLCSKSSSYNIKYIITKLALSQNLIVSNEFKIIKYKIKQGHSLRSTLEVLKDKYNSKILNRFINLILISSTTGTTTSNDFKNLVNNFLEYKKLINQRTSLLLMQKYTILLSSSLILPLILGIVINLIKSLNFNSSLVFFSLSSNLFNITYYCSIVYLLEFIVISAIYLSFLDNNSKKIIVYLILQLPIGLLIFYITKYLI